MRYFPFLLVAFLASCATTGSEVYTPDPGNTNTLDLSYYLSQVAGVKVDGSGRSATIQIRGQSSLASESRPLFVVDGIKVGFDYADVYALVNVASIASINVLKDGVENSMYGLQGSNGVIEINLRE